MVVDFDTSPQHINKGLPLQTLGELPEFMPASLSSLRTVSILPFLDLSGFIVRLAECPLSVHARETVNPGRVFATSMPGRDADQIEAVL